MHMLYFLVVAIFFVIRLRVRTSDSALVVFVAHCSFGSASRTWSNYSKFVGCIFFFFFFFSRCIRMALVHDLAESLVGDITPYDNVSKDEKFRRELVR